MGLARWEDDSKMASLTITHEENVLGTADYLAPEQARDSHSVDKRADIYSLGCTLYFLLTGHAPFPEGSLAQRIAKHLNEMPKSIYEDRKDAPPALVDVCLRMMDKRPEARFQSASEVSQMLSRWLESRGKDFSAGAGGPPKRTIGPPPRRAGSSPRPGFGTFPPNRDRTGATEDTVSNLQHETMKGPSGKPGAPSAGQSNVKFGGSNILGRADQSSPGRSSPGSRSPSSPSHGGSSILGGSVLGRASQSGMGLSGASGTGIGKSSKLPVAKSLDKQPKTPPKPRDDTLGELIEQAVHEVEVAAQQPHQHSHSHSQEPSSPSSQPLQYYRPREPSMPTWVWFVLGGGLLFVVIIVIAFVLSATH